MEGLLNDSEPSNYQLSVSEQFDKVFPYYLSIGMPSQEFWEGDVELVKAYRKAWEYKQQDKNMQAYLNGLYVYDALLRVAPIYHAFAKKGTKPLPYRDKPIEIYTSQEQQKTAENNKSRDMQLRMVEKFKRINKQFRQKEEQK